MKLDFAFLADAASSENGKLFVLGGGITMMVRQAFPAPLNFSLVVGFGHHTSEVGRERGFTAHLVDADGHEVVPPISGKITPEQPPSWVPVGLPLTSHAVLNIAGLPVQGPGEFAFDLMLENDHVGSVPFAVIDAALQQAA